MLLKVQSVTECKKVEVNTECQTQIPDVKSQLWGRSLALIMIWKGFKAMVGTLNYN